MFNEAFATEKWSGCVRLYMIALYRFLLQRSFSGAHTQVHLLNWTFKGEKTSLRVAEGLYVISQ